MWGEEMLNERKVEMLHIHLYINLNVILYLSKGLPGALPDGSGDLLVSVRMFFQTQHI